MSRRWVFVLSVRPDRREWERGCAPCRKGTDNKDWRKTTTGAINHVCDALTHPWAAQVKENGWSSLCGEVRKPGHWASKVCCMDFLEFSRVLWMSSNKRCGSYVVVLNLNNILLLSLCQEVVCYLLMSVNVSFSSSQVVHDNSIPQIDARSLLWLANMDILGSQGKIKWLVFSLLAS